MADRTFDLSNNFTVLYEDGLDGGGINHLPDFINAVTTHGKDTYSRGVEWCAGFGVIGFYFLHTSRCQHMSFIDCHEPAIRWLKRTIEHNNISDKAQTYLSDTISAIPADAKWDLVLANPPHCFDRAAVEHFEKMLDEPQKDDVIRITCDENLSIHKEFFANIRSHLLPGADIFISEVSSFDEIEQLARESGLQVVARYPAPKLSIDCSGEAVILHFKEPS